MTDSYLELEEDVCYLPSSPGDCDNHEQRWFFDASVDQCQPFFYGGCGGNNNNFASNEDCENYCGSRKKIPIEEEFHSGKEVVENACCLVILTVMLINKKSKKK